MFKQAIALGAASLSLGLACLPQRASAIGLTHIWPTSSRNNIKVYLCTTTFTNHIPELNQAQLIANVQTALDVWNEHSGVDIYLNYQGERTSTTSDGCAPIQNPGNGELTIKAESMSNGSQSAAINLNSDGKNSISFYDWTGSGNNITWTHDSQDNNTDFKTVLVHEVGHALGFPDDNTGAVASVMNGTTGAYNRVLWHEDIAKLRDLNESKRYNVKQYTIRHMVSSDQGLNWASEGNLAETTASRVGVTYSGLAASGRKYLVAWRGTNVGTTLNVIQGNGATFDAATKVFLSQASDYGPSVAWGNGKYLMVHVNRADTRVLEYQTSTDGINWTWSVPLQYQGGTNYGSMWEPAVAYGATSNRFVVGWTNWRNQGDDTPLGRMRFCTSADPQASNFSNCTESTNVVNASPTIACSDTANECLVSWTNHTGVSGHQLCWSKYQFDASNNFVSVGSAWCNGDSTKVSPALAFGLGRYMLGWRGGDVSSSANVTRQAAADWPNWKDKRIITSQLVGSPSLVFGPLWSEFAYYYLSRQ